MTDDNAPASKDLSRRAFLKRMAAVGFAVPIVSSFALDGVGSAVPVGDHSHGNQTHQQHQQTFANQYIEQLDEILEHLDPNQSGQF
jgi:hypothetical protein